jgi:hypothetical protein
MPPFSENPYINNADGRNNFNLPSAIIFVLQNLMSEVGGGGGQHPQPKIQDFREYKGFRAPSSSTSSDNDQRCLPMLEVSVDIKVIANASQTTLKQTFLNPSNITIKEATYYFPLYDGSAVIAFRYWIGDSLFEGKVKSKDVANEEFQEAVSQQRAAALLEELSPEVFATSIGNIPPLTVVRVEIDYINELKADICADGVLLTVPTSVAPRYGIPPVENLHGKTLGTSSTAVQRENGLKIHVEVSAAVSIRKIESRTHPISVALGYTSYSSKFDSRKAQATLFRRTTSIGSDFVLLILYESTNMFTSRALLEPAPTREDYAALMMTISPLELSTNAIIQDSIAEVILLADRSGSMDDKMEALISAMQVFIQKIPKNCYFNICSFGETHSMLWPTSRLCTQDNSKIALQHVTHSFASDMGGTEILSALQYVVEKRNTQKDVSTEVIVLTDAEVWDTENTIRFVQETRTKTKEMVRFFALGIGDAVSHRLLEGIGLQGGGFADVVAVDGTGPWESRLVRMLEGALMPSQWQYTIAWPKKVDSSLSTGSNTRARVWEAKNVLQPHLMQAPYIIPTLHAFRSLSIYCFIDPQLLNKMTSINVQAIASSGMGVEMKIPIEQVEARSLTVHHLSAKALVNDLETGRSWMHAGRRGKSHEHGSNSNGAFERAVQEQAQRIGIKWSIVGKWTSFIAADNHLADRSSGSNEMLWDILRGPKEAKSPIVEPITTVMHQLSLNVGPVPSITVNPSPPTQPLGGSRGSRHASFAPGQISATINGLSDFDWDVPPQSTVENPSDIPPEAPLTAAGSFSIEQNGDSVRNSGSRESSSQPSNRNNSTASSLTSWISVESVCYDTTPFARVQHVIQALVSSATGNIAFINKKVISLRSANSNNHITIRTENFEWEYGSMAGDYLTVVGFSKENGRDESSKKQVGGLFSVYARRI